MRSVLAVSSSTSGSVLCAAAAAKPLSAAANRGGEVAMVLCPAEGGRAEGRAVVRLAAVGREPKLGIVVLPQPGIRGGRGQVAQEGEALAKLRLEIRQRIEVAAAAQARDLRAQLFSLRRTLLAPDLALEAAVEVFEEFLLIGAQRLHRGRIEARDRVLPRRRKLPIGRGNPGIGAGRQFAGGARRAAIERRLGSGRRRRERPGEQQQQRQRHGGAEHPRAIRYFFSS